MQEEARAEALAKLDDPEKYLLIDGVRCGDILALTKPKDLSNRSRMG